MTKPTASVLLFNANVVPVTRLNGCALALENSVLLVSSSSTLIAVVLWPPVPVAVFKISCTPSVDANASGIWVIEGP